MKILNPYPLGIFQYPYWLLLDPTAVGRALDLVEKAVMPSLMEMMAEPLTDGHPACSVAEYVSAVSKSLIMNNPLPLYTLAAAKQQFLTYESRFAAQLQTELVEIGTRSVSQQEVVGSLIKSLDGYIPVSYIASYVVQRQGAGTLSPKDAGELNSWMMSIICMLIDTPSYMQSETDPLLIPLAGKRYVLQDRQIIPTVRSATEAVTRVTQVRKRFPFVSEFGFKYTGLPQVAVATRYIDSILEVTS